MAAKKFKFLNQKIGLQSINPKSTVTYVDIAMPYETNDSNELQPLTDESAIVNAVATLFTTMQLGRPLVPTYGLDLREYIAEPISDDITYFIREDIIKAIETWEPRIKVREVKVTKTEDDNEIEIVLIVWFPTLRSKYMGIGVSINQDGIKTRSIPQ